jgi:hypothetical protein
MREAMPVATAHLFAPLSRELVGLLESLEEGDWARPASSRWRVRDVAAHLLDGDLRRLSFERDAHPPPAPPPAPEGFPVFLGALNQSFVDAMGRVSPRGLTGLLAWTGPELARFYEEKGRALASDPRAPGFFPVSWAGEEGPGPWWLDMGREFVERWHHQQQIRDAVGAPPLTGPEWMGPLLGVAVHAFRGSLLPLLDEERPRPAGTRLQVVFRGEGGGAWVVERRNQGWTLFEGNTPHPDARLLLDVAEAWRLLLRGASPVGGEREGDPALLGRALRARAVVTGAEVPGATARGEEG